MNLFEKIFNHQIISQLEDSGTFMVTSHERAWLKTMLAHPASNDAFTTETLTKLHKVLEADSVMDTSQHLIEKARTIEKQVYHPLLRHLQSIIRSKQGICISYGQKRGKAKQNQVGFPYRLEYSMVKREWYLLWYHSRHRTFMSTRLEKIYQATPTPVEPEIATNIINRIENMLEAKKSNAMVEVVPLYNAEISRILYAFSSFEKSVTYDEAQGIYHIHLSLLEDEMEYLLSKLRFLGKRVRVVEDMYLKKRMLESATKVLERYGIESGENPS